MYRKISFSIKTEVANLIRAAALNGALRLLIAPSDVKVLSKRSAKSLSSINDDRSYRTKSNDYESTTTMSRYRSQPRLNDDQNNDYFSEPTEPLPRKKKKKNSKICFILN